MTSRPWRSVDPDLFRFTTTDLRELHIGIMAAFEWAGVLSPVLRLDGVRRALREVRWDEPVSDEQLLAALGSLTGWGLLDSSQDHANRHIRATARGDGLRLPRNLARPTVLPQRQRGNT